MKAKILILTICTIFYYSVSTAQSYLVLAKPFGNKYWGYANEKGEMVIPAQYEKAYKFSPDGYATVYDKKKRQYMFINTKGEPLATDVTDFKIHDGFGFDVDGFVDGLVAIKVGEKWGYLSSTGKVAIPAKFDDANEFNSGYAAAKIGNDYYILDTKGNETKVAINGVLDIKTFSENLAPYRAADKLFGFIGPDGKEVIRAQFESVGYFTNGLAWAKNSNKQLGYINTKGDWIVQPTFEAGKNFDPVSGLARVKTNAGAWVYINRNEEITYVNDTEVWGDFKEGLSDGKKGKLKGFYNEKGVWVIQPQFDGVRDFKNGFAAAKQGDKWGMIDKTGKWLIQPMFDGIKDMEKINP